MEQLPLFMNEHSLAQIHGDLMHEQIPFDAVEALLEEYLLNELSIFEMLEVESTNESDINCKWKYSSALQKSIRRGYVEDSVRYAVTYHSLDSVGFWTRLVIVAFEDIGIGDVWTVASTLTIARSKIFRQKLGGEAKCIHYLIKKLAESVKDRTIADLYQILENRSLPPKNLSILKSASPQQLSDIALSDQYQFETRIASTWLLWGTGRIKNGRLPFTTGDRELFEETIKRLKVPGIIKYITLRGMVACRIAMNLTYSFVWLIKEKSPYVKVIKTSLPERYYIKGLPEEAYDQYTREGKAAYQRFYRSCNPVNEFLTDRGIVGIDEITTAIGIAVFISESALLAKRIDFEGAEQVYRKTVEDDYKKTGLCLADGVELSMLILENGDILRQVRQGVISGRRHAPYLPLNHKVKKA